MNIKQINSYRNIKTNFGSKNSPVEPFKVKTTKGILKVQELTKAETVESGRFIFNCALEAHEDWQEFFNAIKDSKHKTQEKTNWIHNISNGHKTILSKGDRNSTILVGRDVRNRIKALFSLHNYDELAEDGIKDLRTGHLDECYIDAKYRNQGIGKIILAKLLETANGHFTDIFAEADNKAVSFYKREGFSFLDTSNLVLKAFSETLLNSREDRDTITLMSKSIDLSSPWWKRLAKMIKH